MGAIGQFVAAITGQKTYTRAIKQTTEAIKDQNKAQNEQLSSLDKLNNLTSGSGDSDSEESGGMFEENVLISDKFMDISDWLKNMWENADFTELGTVLGTKIKNALDSIGWESIKETAAKIGKSIGTLINGFVEVEGLGDSIGRTIGEAINTGVTGINAFLDNTHWDSVGNFIADGFNGAIKAIHWGDIGHLLATSFGAIIKTIIGFFSELDFGSIASALSQFVIGIFTSLTELIQNIEWSKLPGWIIGTIVDFFSNLDYKGLFSSLGGLIASAISAVLSYDIGLIKVLVNIGKNIIDGFKNGIWEGIKNIGTWIYDHIFKPFIDGFKKAFGIASPSTVMEEMGTFIIQGLLNGIKSLVGNVVNSVKSIWNSIKNTFMSFMEFLTGVFTGGWEKAWNGIVNIFEGVKRTISNIVNSILGVVESLANGVISGINFVIGALNSFSFDVPKGVPFIGGMSVGFNIQEIPTVSIPRLATGAVIPANREFLAVLGDQKHGTNIEAPLDTIEKASEKAIMKVFSALGLQNGVRDNQGDIVINIDGNEVFRVTQKYAQEHFNRTGRPPFPI